MIWLLFEWKEMLKKIDVALALRYFALKRINGKKILNSSKMDQKKMWSKSNSAVLGTMWRVMALTSWGLEIRVSNFIMIPRPGMEEYSNYIIPEIVDDDHRGDNSNNWGGSWAFSFIARLAGQHLAFQACRNVSASLQRILASRLLHVLLQDAAGQ